MLPMLASSLITHTDVPNTGNEVENLPIERLNCEILQEIQGEKLWKSKATLQVPIYRAIAREGEHG